MNGSRKLVIRLVQLKQYADALLENAQRNAIFKHIIAFKINEKLQCNTHSSKHKYTEQKLRLKAANNVAMMT